MTDYSHFEKLVAEDKNLNVLINQKKYGAIMTIRRKDWMTPDFIDWISPKYFLAFTTIYENNKSDNVAAVCAVIRESFLANQETKEKMAEILWPKLNESIESLDVFLTQINESKYKSIEYINELALGLNILTVSTFKNLEASTLIEKKEKYSTLLLRVADRFKKVSKRRDRINYDFYEKVNRVLKSLDLEGDFAERVEVHEKRLGRKDVWYVVGTVVIILLLLLRFLGRMG